jgi:hypothetical protein
MHVYPSVALKRYFFFIRVLHSNGLLALCLDVSAKEDVYVLQYCEALSLCSTTDIHTIPASLPVSGKYSFVH